MNNKLFIVFRILIALVLIGKMLNWFLEFSNETNRVLNILMFSLIGIAYIVMGYVWEHLLTKSVILTCGLFLIAMNFFTNSTLVNIMGIISILTPITIARLARDKEERVKVTKG
jgi:ABC-type siderophore export system fused ATPase/permease subunit